MPNRVMPRRLCYNEMLFLRPSHVVLASGNGEHPPLKNLPLTNRMEENFGASPLHSTAMY